MLIRRPELRLSELDDFADKVANRQTPETRTPLSDIEIVVPHQDGEDAPRLTVFADLGQYYKRNLDVSSTVAGTNAHNAKTLSMCNLA